MRPEPPHRAVFVSDVHLGSAHCHAAEFADFIAQLQCRHLYLVGDILDLWWLAEKRSHWDAAHHRVFEALHAQARAGMRVTYIPGNHDRPLRQLCGVMLPGARVRRRAVHELLDGRRLLVTHGDDYDGEVQAGGAKEAFGHWLYYLILSGNKMANRVRRRLGMRYWSLAEDLKRRSASAERYIARFVDAGLADVRRRGLDGIVCGHIHRRDLRVVDGLVYANDGDWVESLSALVEDVHGHLRLVSHHGEELAHVPARLRLESESAAAGDTRRAA